MKKTLGVIILGWLLAGCATARQDATCIEGNCIDGQGTMTYPDGAKYVGEWKDGELTGQGTFTYFDGSVYVGEFKDHFFHGQGILTEPNGETFKVVYNNGQQISKVPYQDQATKKIEMTSMIDDAKNTCKSLGFTAGTEKFADCTLKLYSQTVELAAKNNQQVVMQGQSSGSNVMTIYDPVRDSDALIKRGQGLMNGTCTFADLSNC